MLVSADRATTASLVLFVRAVTWLFCTGMFASSLLLSLTTAKNSSSCSDLSAYLNTAYPCRNWAQLEAGSELMPGIRSLQHLRCGLEVQLDCSVHDP